jgi:hypothetical protein
MYKYYAVYAVTRVPNVVAVATAYLTTKKKVDSFEAIDALKRDLKSKDPTITDIVVINFILLKEGE